MASLDTLSALVPELNAEHLDDVDGGMMTTPRWVFCMYYPEFCYPERY